MQDPPPLHGPQGGAKLLLPLLAATGRCLPYLVHHVLVLIALGLRLPPGLLAHFHCAACLYELVSKASTVTSCYGFCGGCAGRSLLCGLMWALMLSSMPACSSPRGVSRPTTTKPWANRQTGQTLLGVQQEAEPEQHSNSVSRATMAGDLKAWRLDLDALSPDKLKNLDPPGYDAAIGKELVGRSMQLKLPFDLAAADMLANPHSQTVSTSSSQKKKDSGMVQRKQQASPWQRSHAWQHPYGTPQRCPTHHVLCQLLA